jgi:3-deoxy-D-manno-octulosonate 8-phosphate phosphatase (KDO 8-P phosphatase)
LRDRNMAHINSLSPSREPILRIDAAARARKVRMILLDVDSVLTDGKIIYNGAEEDEIKSFHAQDGVGIRMAQRIGIRFGVITGRKSRALERRAAELGILEVHQQVRRKGEAFKAIKKSSGLGDNEIAFVGDDLVDLPILRKAGFAATVPEAVPEMARISHYVSSRSAGYGAVREILDFVMRVQGAWKRATLPFS